MIEALRVAWSFRRFFGYAVLVAVIGWLWVSNAGLENDLLKQKIRYTDLTNQVEKQNAQIDAYKTVEKIGCCRREGAQGGSRRGEVARR